MITRLILLVAIFSVTGCGIVWNENIKTAENFCQDKQGIEYLKGTSSRKYTNVTCNDGTSAELYKGK